MPPEEPRNSRGRRTHAAILDAAWRLIEDDGAERATMAAIARDAGITRRALYLHFPSRTELLAALHRHVDDRLDLTASIAPIAAASDAVSALRLFAVHLARYHSRIARLDAALLRAAPTDPEAAALIDAGSDEWHAACMMLAGRLEDEGALASPWTRDTAADLLWSLMFPETPMRLGARRGWTIGDRERLLGTLIERTLVDVSRWERTEPA